jgi:hypothetical protein
MTVAIAIETIVRVVAAIAIMALGIGSCVLVWQRDTERRREP